MIKQVLIMDRQKKMGSREIVRDVVLLGAARKAGVCEGYHSYQALAFGPGVAHCAAQSTRKL